MIVSLSQKVSSLMEIKEMAHEVARDPLLVVYFRK